jgi:DNA replication protein DnaC
MLEGYSCPDCGKSDGYHCLDGDVPIYFCATTKCLNDDMQLTKPDATKIKSSRYDPIERYGLGTIYRNASLVNWQISEQSKEQVRRWVRNPKNFLILTGGPGTGKTFFSAAILNYFAESGSKKDTEVFYTNTRRFFEYLQKNIGEDNNQYQAVKYFSRRDMGAAANSDWKQEMLLDLFDYRYENELPTIITTNVHPKDFSDMFGIRTASRLKQKNNIIIGTGYEDKR